jgi:hypothetical protein
MYLLLVVRRLWSSSRLNLGIHITPFATTKLSANPAHRHRKNSPIVPILQWALAVAVPAAVSRLLEVSRPCLLLLLRSMEHGTLRPGRRNLSWELLYSPPHLGVWGRIRAEKGPGDVAAARGERRAAPEFWLPGRRHRVYGRVDFRGYKRAPWSAQGLKLRLENKEEHWRHHDPSQKGCDGAGGGATTEGVTDGGELHHYSPYVGASSQAAPAARSWEQRRLWKVHGDREMYELGGVRETTPPASIRTYDGFTLVKVLIPLLPSTTRFCWCCVYMVKPGASRTRPSCLPSRVVLSPI